MAIVYLCFVHQFRDLMLLKQKKGEDKKMSVHMFL